MNTTLSPVTVKRFNALQGELVELIEQDYAGLTPKLGQIIRAFEFTQIELAVYRERGYGRSRGAGQPEEDRCALACAFLAKAVLDLKTTRALIERLQADSKLRRLCGFDMRFALPSEATFSRAFAELAISGLIERVHASMIKDTLGDQLIGHISRDSTAIEARETIAKKDKPSSATASAGPIFTTTTQPAEPAVSAEPVASTEPAAPATPKKKRGRPAKGDVRTPPEPSVLERQRSQTRAQMVAELDTSCATGTKKNAQGYKISWKGYKWVNLDMRR
jgi:hypothetical protein